MQLTNQFIIPPDPIKTQIKYVYPWESTELDLLCQRLYTLAFKTGYTGTLENFKMEFGAYLEANNIITKDDFEEYNGLYEVIPLPLMQQILQTENKVLTENITIAPIPFATTTNTAGGYTAVIG